MNRDEAKKILLLYRTEADAADPQIAEALALAKTDAELSRWFDEHRAAQNALREKFRQIEIPGGLVQQIVSEQKAKAKRSSRRQKSVAVAAVGAMVVAAIALAAVYFPFQRQPSASTLADFQKQMIDFASSPYGMALATNDLAQIHDYLAQNHGVADYTLPASLEKTAATGCAVKYWAGAQVSMICFRTGKPLPANQPGDLWLFVTDCGTVKNAPNSATPQFSQINNVATATWTQNGKLYLLGIEGDEQTLRKYL